MKTTIFPADKSKKKTNSVTLLQILNLALAILYLTIELFLVSVPQSHGHGVGMGHGVGNTLTFSLPLFLILFLLMILFHLISVFQNRLQVRFILGTGLGQVITTTLLSGLLLFSRQSFNLLQIEYPYTNLVLFFLTVSLILGVYMIIGKVRKEYGNERERDRNISSFPLPKNRYRNIRPIGEGGVGTIWYAERIGDGTPVVVKVPRKEDEMTGLSFMQEISIWKDLQHPHIATLLSANILPVPYLEIEYLPGSVADLKTPIPVEQAVLIIQGLVSALLYAHGRGVTHCDIKPTNILLTYEGIPKLTDWGLARSGRDRWSVSGFSPTYAAPEQRQMNSECTATTDIWQVGMVCAEIFTGRTEIPAGDEEVFQTQKGGVLLSIIQKCLASDPARRYQSVQELSDDLDIV